MVFNTSDDNRRTLPFPKYAGLIGVKVGLDVPGNPRFTVLCAVNEMDEVFD